MKSEAAESKTLRLSDRLSVTITAGPAGLAVEWDPEMPERLTRGELRRYRAARAEMVAGLAEKIGMPVVVVETTEGQ